MNRFAWFIILIILETIAMYYIKMYSVNESNIHYLIMGMVFYAMIAYVFYRTIKANNGIAITNTIWNILSTTSGIIIGMIFFDENITFKQKIAIITGIISIISMS
jgi:multidrug transporter EmrE-like cation transporter